MGSKTTKLLLLDSLLQEIDQESRGVIRERACYAIDRSLKRALQWLEL